MSYEIVKNINVKERKILSADNNIRPLTYTLRMGMNHLSEDEFIKKVLIYAVDGELQFQNNKNLLRFRIVLNLYENEIDAKLREDIHNKRWNNYDYVTKSHRYTEEEIKQANEKLGNLLLWIYKNYKITKGKYVIKYGSVAYVKKLSNAYNRLSYTYGKNNATVYNTFEEAQMIARQINKNFDYQATIEEL